MPQAVIIKTTGERKVVFFTNETSYKVLSEAVGGYIECVSLRENLDLWVNEEGRLNGAEPNRIASEIFAYVYPEVVDEIPKHLRNHAIVGDVILTGGTDDEGFTLGLSDTQVAEIARWGREVTL
jgi:hypothetical protein